MDIEFQPEPVIDRLCQHHQVTATQLLAALLEAIGRFHFFGSEAFASPNDARQPNIYDELEHMCGLLGRDAGRESGQAPASVMEAVLMCVHLEGSANEALHQHAMQPQAPAPAPGSADHDMALMHGKKATRQRALELVMRELMNRLHTMSLAAALEEEEDERRDAEGGP